MSTVAEIAEQVQRTLTRWFRDAARSTEPGFVTVTHGSTQVFVRTVEWRGGSSLVSIHAPIASGVPVSWQLYQWVARNSNKYVFGHVALTEGSDGTGSVDFVHSILGDYLDAEELLTAVQCVGVAANELDEQVVANFGGHRFIDGT